MAASSVYASGSEAMGPLIRTERLTRHYRHGGGIVAALEGISFEVVAGEFVAVMGPSGSGKSTLMYLLGLLDRPTAGAYHFAGEDVSRLEPDLQATLRNHRIGFVFQTFNLLARNTALENIELPQVYAGVAKRERRQRALAALEAVGLGRRRDHWPHQLSGGEQQRVAIARAMVNDPALILADEPTGALDSRTGLEVLAIFQALNRAGRTIVLVTHDARIARHAGRILRLGDGRLMGEEHVAAPTQAENVLAGLIASREAGDAFAEAGP